MNYDIDKSAVANFMFEFTSEMSDLPQDRKIHYMEQVILHLMDYTEQSPEEKLWCDLLTEFGKLVKKYEGANKS